MITKCDCEDKKRGNYLSFLSLSTTLKEQECVISTNFSQELCGGNNAKREESSESSSTISNKTRILR